MPFCRRVKYTFLIIGVRVGRGISLHGLFWKIFARTGPEIQGFKSYLCCVSPFFVVMSLFLQKM